MGFAGRKKKSKDQMQKKNDENDHACPKSYERHFFIGKVQREGETLSNENIDEMHTSLKKA